MDAIFHLQVWFHVFLHGWIWYYQLSSTFSRGFNWGLLDKFSFTCTALKPCECLSTFRMSWTLSIAKQFFSYCNIIFVSAAFSTSQWNRQVVRDIFQEVPLIWRPCTHTAATKHFSIMQSLVSDIASPFICCHALSFECQEGAASTKVELRDSGKTRAKVVPMFTSTNVVWLLTSFCRKYRGIRTLCAHCISSDVTE